MDFLNKTSPILAIVFLFGCAKEKADTYQGYVEGEFVYIASPIEGRLDTLNVHRGEPIQNKSPLFALESVSEMAAQQQAQATLKAALSQLEDLKTGKRPVEVDVVKAQLTQAIATEKKSALQWQRDKAQFAIGGISKAELDNSQFTHDADVAKVQEYTNQVATSKLPARKDLIREQAAQVNAAKAALAQAQWRLDQKTLFATQNGLIFDTLYRLGEWVPAGNPVIQMLPPQNIKVRFFVPEAILGKLHIGQSIQIQCDGCNTTLAATLTYISTQAEYTPPVIYSNETRSKLTYMIEAHPSLENAPALHPGQPVTVTLG